MTQGVSSEEEVMEVLEEKSGQPDRGRLVIQVAGVVAVLAVLALLALGLRYRAAGRVDKGPAPAFTLQLFDGGQVSLDELQGKAVVLNFWASWCKPCAEEAAVLEAGWRQYKDKGIVFVGVDYIDTEPDARAYLKRYGISYPNGPDLGSKISYAYRMQGVPETFFISPDGRILDVYIGPLNREALLVRLDRLSQ
ncbi:MAG: TlpA family protein disulfide reductase [Chloroflexi bacterium]|nr:TlpA family protein disulfide reductase [Chloroflexota bacterium]